MAIINSTKVVKTCWKSLYKWTAYMICMYIFTIYLCHGIYELIQDKPLSTMKLIDELDDSLSIPVPAISICPYEPLDPEKLIQRGINISCPNQLDCRDTILDLQGYIKPSDSFIWSDVELSATSIIKNLSWAGRIVNVTEWQRSTLATMPCYKWVSNENFTIKGTDNVIINFKRMTELNCRGMSWMSCNETEEKCGINCTTRFLQYYNQWSDLQLFVFIHANNEFALPGLWQPLTILHPKENSIE
ncbi:unnamed protein product, partial [Meganyctiphanes norvegica]